MEFVSTLTVYEAEMNRTQVKRPLFKRLFSTTSKEDLIQKMEASVTDTNASLDFTLSPSCVI